MPKEIEANLSFNDIPATCRVCKQRRPRIVVIIQTAGGVKQTCLCKRCAREFKARSVRVNPEAPKPVTN